MHDWVDLRSDTVTKPTPGMLQAMAEAEVGDDVLGDDPTVAALEARAASLMGKEAGLFVPSGTMSNTIGIAVHTRPGDEVLMDADAHSMRYEAGAPAALLGVLVRQFRSVRGVPDVDEIWRAVQTESLHTPGTALIVLENTHNVSGGAVIPLNVHRDVWDLARAAGVAVHLDGARLLNAAVATAVPAKSYAAYADTVTFCLSKGLGCPVGSVLCGSRETMERARRLRKRLGGGLRQSGILAAAGLYALDHHVDRLTEDHRRARALADTLTGLPGVEVDLATVQTNMVYFGTACAAARWVEELQKRGVRCLALGANRVRLVTHLDVDDADIARAQAALRAVAEELA
jgi:threonine aldolase